ncbi:MAG: hypothetical protein KDC44_20735, partial [Phaeodactylibacter sp.]|nr:hypothetical protein [Phaeodactylibacter sp.]
RLAFMRLAMQARVPLGDWMLSPIHPILEGFERWTYPYGTNPVGEALSRAILNLPTDVSVQEAERVLDFLRQHADQLVTKAELLG